MSHRSERATDDHHHYYMLHNAHAETEQSHGFLFMQMCLSIFQRFDLFCYGTGHGKFHGHGHDLIVTFIVMVIVFFVSLAAVSSVPSL